MSKNKTNTENDLTVVVELLVEKIKTINHLVDMLTERKTKTKFKIDILTEDIPRRVHIECDKNNEIHICKACEQKFDDKRSLRKHILELHPRVFKCNQCDDIFDKRWHLKEFKCKECGLDFFLIIIIMGYFAPS